MTDLDLVATGWLEASQVEHICLDSRGAVSCDILAWDRTVDEEVAVEQIRIIRELRGRSNAQAGR